MKHFKATEKSFVSDCGIAHLPADYIRSVFPLSDRSAEESLIAAIFGSRNTIAVDYSIIARSIVSLIRFNENAVAISGRATIYARWIERFRECAWNLRNTGTLSADRRILSAFRRAGFRFVEMAENLSRASEGLNATERLNPADAIDDRTIVGDSFGFSLSEKSIPVPENRRRESLIPVSVREKIRDARRNSDCDSFVPPMEITAHPWKRSVSNGADSMNGQPSNAEKDRRVWITRGSDWFRNSAR